MALPAAAALGLAVASFAAGGVGLARADAVLAIRGGGNGHGVGMSQYGALGYAQHGFDYPAILAHYYRGTQLGRLAAEPVVRVLVADASAATISGAAEASGVRLSPRRAYTVRLLGDGKMAILEGSRVRARFTGAPLRVGGPGPLVLAGVGTYRGTLELRPDGRGGIQAVDAAGLEDYVRGVVSAEVPADWPSAVLAAQAVAARTYAITTDAGGIGFDQYADTRSQMYLGVGAETPATDAAVRGTRSVVVTYAGRPATTYFFSSSGGATENIEYAWPAAAPQPWLRGVPDPFDSAGGDPDHAWSADMSAGEAQRRLGSLVHGHLIGIRVTRHGFSPRVMTAQVLGSRGTSSVSGERLRRLLGLRTTLASFTTISTRLARRGQTAAAPGEAASAGGLGGLVPLVRSMVAGLDPVLSGRVFPYAAGAPLALERQDRSGHFAAAGTGRLGPGGRFSLSARRPGRYRVRVGRLSGPVLAVGG